MIDQKARERSRPGRRDQDRELIALMTVDEDADVVKRRLREHPNGKGGFRKGRCFS